MTCICEHPDPHLRRGCDRKYSVVCMSCGRIGYKSSVKNAALHYWEQATEPAKFLDKPQMYQMPAGFAQHPFLYDTTEENDA